MLKAGWVDISDDTAGSPGSGVSRGLTVLLPAQPEVINTLVDDDGSVEDAVLPGQRHQVVQYADEGDPILVHGDVAEVPHVSVLGPWSSVVVAERVEMSASSSTVI